MEKANSYYCHTCVKEFKLVTKSEDDEVECPTCKDTFVELIEDSSQLDEAKGSLPVNANGEKINAKYNDGILNLVIPKKEEAKVKPAKG